MTIGPEALRDLLDLAIEAARAAGEIVTTSRPAVVDHKTGADSLAAEVVTDVDRRAEAAIVDVLSPSRRAHGFALLTEERDDDGLRLHAPAFWCVDPLDGTLAFIEGKPGYAVSVALVARDGMPLLGVVVDVVEGTTWSAARGLGVFRDGTPWTPPAPVEGAPLHVFMDRSFATWPDRAAIEDELAEIATELGYGTPQIEVGAAAVINACHVLTTPPACYFKPPKPTQGGGSLWDYAATACLFHEAGAIATDIHGAALDLNREGDTFLNRRGVLFASDDELATRIRGLPFVARL